ncbi:MAG TPA: type I-U CRISPR-associated protein Csb2 [Pirellulales bacterium]|nr:type I-U CRISPR-associated protein Csb2 [Pirellulales bacterium]
MSHLLLTIRFLDGRYHGKIEGDAREWPPAPMRLFASLLAGAKGRWNDEVPGAFRWLERQPPPLIRATNGRQGAELLTYVPNNNSDSGEIVRTAKVIKPTLLDDPPIVEYLWEIEPGDENHAHAIAQAARHIRALGWGIDMAIGHGCVVNLPPLNGHLVEYKPREFGVSGGSSLRVPVLGSLDSLEAAYEASLNRIRAGGEVHDQPGPPVCEKRVYATSIDRPFCAFALETPDEETAACRPQRIKELVGMIRGLAACKARSAGETIDVNRVILGHPPDASGPRLSILPLPSIGHPHSDGQIRRVILAESAGGDGSLSLLLSRVLHNAALQPDRGDDAFSPREVRLAHLKPEDRFLRFYTALAHVWASVTPVLLPGYDDRKLHRGNQQKRLARAEQLVCKALAQAGIGVPARIELSRVPFWAGTLHSRKYRPREKLAHYPRWHVRLAFDRPWIGPLAIGAGRHCGFGLFAAVDAGSCLPLGADYSV